MTTTRKGARFPLAAALMLVAGLMMIAIMPVSAANDKFPNYPEYKGQPVTITMWAWTSNENYSIEAFEKAYPNIHVEWSNVGSGSTEYTKVLTCTTAGKGLPDVIMCEYTYAPQFMEYGSFQPVNKWIPDSFYKAFFPAMSLKWTSMDGKIYGTPQDSGAMIMVYRKDIFDKYGLTVPKTWDEFAQNAIKLHKANPNISFSTFPNNWVLWPIGIVWQAGGRLFDYADGKWYVDFTNPTAEKVLNYWQRLINEKAVKVDMWWTADWYKELNDGKVATVICGAWFPEWLQLNSPKTKGLWRVAPMPQWDPSNPQNGAMGGSGFYVSSQSKHPEAAAIFVLWLNSHEESLANLHEHSQLPVLVSDVFTDKVAPKLADVKYAFFGGQKIMPIVVEANRQVKTSFVALPVMDYVQSSMETELKKVTSGKETMADFLKNWQGSVVTFMRKQGFNNLVIDQLP